MIRQLGKELPISPELPAVLGMDFAGIVESVGEGISEYVAEYADGQGFDIVFDSVGGPNMTNSFEAAALNGQVASTVAMVELDLSVAHFKGLSLHVVFTLIPMIHNYKREKHAKILRKLADIFDDGGLRPVLNEEKFFLEDAEKPMTAFPAVRLWVIKSLSKYNRLRVSNIRVC